MAMKKAQANGQRFFITKQKVDLCRPVQLIVVRAIILAGIAHEVTFRIHHIVLLNYRIIERFCAIVIEGFVRDAVYVLANIEECKCFIRGFEEMLIVGYAIVIDQ